MIFSVFDLCIGVFAHCCDNPHVPKKIRLSPVPVRNPAKKEHRTACAYSKDYMTKRGSISSNIIQKICFKFVTG